MLNILKKSRKWGIILLITITLFLTGIYPAQGKIYRRVLKDGTILYYNTKKRKSRKKWTKLNLSSKYDALIERIAREHNLDPFLIKCIIRVESNFKADAVSVAGAMGLMQIMQEIARYYNCSDPLDPEKNLTTGIRHFKELMDYFHNKIPLALAAYHAGIGRVKKRMTIPPIKSTIRYVNDIMYLYSGRKNFTGPVRRLYTRITRDGTIIIYSK